MAKFGLNLLFILVSDTANAQITRAPCLSAGLVYILRMRDLWSSPLDYFTSGCEADTSLSRKNTHNLPIYVQLSLHILQSCFTVFRTKVNFISKDQGSRIFKFPVTVPIQNYISSIHRQIYF